MATTTFEAPTDIILQKLNLIHWLTELKDESKLSAVEQIKNCDTQDWWNEISWMEKESIEAGLSDMQKGHTVPHTTARKRYKKWLIP